MSKKEMTMGVTVGNRGFFPDHLAKSGREDMLRVLEANGVEAVSLTPAESKHGAVETREESRHCAELFKRNRERQDARVRGRRAITDDSLNIFGGAGVVEIPKLQKLLHFICVRGFEHQVAANLSTVASAVYEASTRYLGWDMYYHGCENGVC